MVKPKSLARGADRFQANGKSCMGAISHCNLYLPTLRYRVKDRFGATFGR